MNKLVALILLFFLSLNTYAQQQVISGVYRGRNIYVQNPYINESERFCIKSIQVNGHKILQNLNSSAITIDLSKFYLNDSISIIILHSETCTPKILNPRVLLPGSGFAIIQASADNAAITWITTGEQDKNAYFELEKMKLDNWVPIIKIQAKGDIDSNQYSVGATHYSGQNLFRVHYISGEKSFYSEEFEFYSSTEPISFYPIKNIDELISLSKSTDYIIKNFEGKILKKGIGQDIFVGDLKSGEYILVIENREENFFKPEPEEY